MEYSSYTQKWISFVWQTDQRSDHDVTVSLDNAAASPVPRVRRGNVAHAPTLAIGDEPTALWRAPPLPLQLLVSSVVSWLCSSARLAHTTLPPRAINSPTRIHARAAFQPPTALNAPPSPIPIPPHLHLHLALEPSLSSSSTSTGESVFLGSWRRDVQDGGGEGAGGAGHRRRRDAVLRGPAGFVGGGGACAARRDAPPRRAAGALRRRHGHHAPQLGHQRVRHRLLLRPRRLQVRFWNSPAAAADRHGSLSSDLISFCCFSFSQGTWCTRTGSAPPTRWRRRSTSPCRGRRRCPAPGSFSSSTRLLSPHCCFFLHFLPSQQGFTPICSPFDSFCSSNHAPVVEWKKKKARCVGNKKQKSRGI